MNTRITVTSVKSLLASYRATFLELRAQTLLEIESLFSNYDAEPTLLSV